MVLEQSSDLARGYSGKAIRARMVRHHLGGNLPNLFIPLTIKWSLSVGQSVLSNRHQMSRPPEPFRFQCFVVHGVLSSFVEA
jgi:hypothetical protein